MRGEGGEVTSGGGQRAKLEFANEESQNKVVEASHDPSGIGFGHASFVFMQRNVSAVM